MRDHTLVHEVDLKFIEQAKAKRESKRVPDVERDPAQVSLEGKCTAQNSNLFAHYNLMT